MTEPRISPRDATSETWEAVLVGAGIAGSCLAGALAAQGQRVLLLEKGELPRSKVCGGCLNSRAVDRLHRFGAGGVLAALEPHPLGRIQFRQANGTLAEFGLEFDSGYEPVAVSRYQLDEALAKWAISKGAVYCDRTTVLDTRLEEDSRIVIARDPERQTLEFRSGAVIACDGLNSNLARAARLVNEKAEGFFKLNEKIGCSIVVPDLSVLNVPLNTIMMASAEEGYVGVVRIEPGWINIAGALKTSALNETKEKPGEMATRILREVGLTVSDRVAEASWTTCSKLNRSVTSPAAERLLLVGDAAGYIEPITGEGMAWALEGAMLAAEQLFHGWTEDTADDYAEGWMDLVGSRRRTVRAAAFAVDSRLRRQVALGAMVRVPAIGRHIAKSLNETHHLERMT